MVRQLNVDDQWKVVAPSKPWSTAQYSNAPEAIDPSLRNEAEVDVEPVAGRPAMIVGIVILVSMHNAIIRVVGAYQAVLISET